MARKRRSRKSSSKTKVFLVAEVLVLVLLIGCAAGLSVYYQELWFPGTQIGGMDLSGKTLKETQAAFAEHMNSYSLTIKGRNDGKDVITGSEIGLKTDTDAVLEKAFQEQHKLPWIFSFLTKEKSDPTFNISYDKDALTKRYQASVLVTGNENYKIVAPYDSHLGYSEELGYAEVLKENQGNKLIQEAALPKIEEALSALDDEINFTDSVAYPDVYEKPPHTTNATNLDQAVDDYNKYVLHWINLKMYDDSVIALTPKEMEQWVSINEKDQSVSFDEEACKKWVENFCLERKTVGLVRNFTAHDGSTVKMKNGDYGWQIDYYGIRDAILKEIKEGTTKDEMTAYIGDPTDANRKSMTLDYTVKYKSRGFQYNAEDISQDWDPKNYSEVDLSDQMVYVYKDGELAFSCKTVSGLPVEGRQTRTGIYNIKDKKDEYVLKGDDYEVPTQYWVRITWSGTGYHYMMRSDWSNWSPTLYKTRGSHGCLNLQLKDAEQLYKLVKMNDAVFIHR